MVPVVKDLPNTKIIQQELFRWWSREGRKLPWRRKESDSLEVSADQLREHAISSYQTSEGNRDPYRVVVAELMLQQTQVDRVIPKYQAWLEKWPTIQALAKADLPTILVFWQGLGYNRRARFLWKLAQEIVDNRANTWPQLEEELVELPGIGRYTARAIMSFAFGKPVGVVDTNVKRILSRVWLAGESLSEKEFFHFADNVLPPGQIDAWNQLLMDFGALVCTSRSPKCVICPLNQVCQANLSAQKAGFKTYAEQLATKVSAKSTKPKPRFEETDRYFRGRILDELRQQSYDLDEFTELMSERYGLTDHERFVRMVKKMAKDGLIQIENDVLSLGSI